MYFITALTHVNFDVENVKGYPNSRCFGYYADLETAKRKLKYNTMDIHELYYNYAVIEKIGEGIHADVEEEYWYKYNRENGIWKPINKPETTKGICNFARVG